MCLISAEMMGFTSSIDFLFYLTTFATLYSLDYGRFSLVTIIKGTLGAVRKLPQYYGNTGCGVFKRGVQN